jgi:hypothetical protein
LFDKEHCIVTQLRPGKELRVCGLGCPGDQERCNCG